MYRLRHKQTKQIATEKDGIFYDEHNRILAVDANGKVVTISQSFDTTSFKYDDREGDFYDRAWDFISVDVRPAPEWEVLLDEVNNETSH